MVKLVLCVKSLSNKLLNLTDKDWKLILIGSQFLMTTGMPLQRDSGSISSQKIVIELVCHIFAGPLLTFFRASKVLKECDIDHKQKIDKLFSSFKDFSLPFEELHNASTENLYMYYSVIPHVITEVQGRA